MKKTVAITGATGFVGRHAMTELLARGHSLKALARNPVRSALPGHVEVITGSLTEGEALQNLLKNADTVVHIAGVLNGLRAADLHRANAEGTARLADAARRAHVRRFVYVSSLAAREPDISAYAASKRAGEEALLNAAGNEMAALILRPPAVYGPNDRATLPLFKELTRRVAMIPGTALGRFSLIHVGDLARVIADAAAGDESGTIELSDGKADGYGWADLLQVAQRERGGAITPIFLPRFVPDAVAGVSEVIARVRRKPGMVNRGKIAELYHGDWVSRGEGWRLDKPIPFSEGFSQTLSWYRQHGWLPARGGPDRSGAEERHGIRK